MSIEGKLLFKFKLIKKIEIKVEGQFKTLFIIL